MRSFVLILALAVPSALTAMGSELYSVPMNKVLNVAVKALKEVYPEIASDKVALANDVYVHCTSTRHQEHVFALDESFKPCEAVIELDLTATSVEHLYLNRDGNCVRVMPPGLMLVYVYEDGSSKVETYRGEDSELQVVECTHEVITQLADEPKRVPSEGKAFSVDTNTILELAFAAAIEEKPDTPPEDWDFDGMMSLFCDVHSTPGTQAGQGLKIEPCTAQVSFFDRSVPTRKAFSHEDGRCWVVTASEGIKVWVYANESTRVNHFGDSYREVECNEGFFDALRQQSG